eukprot:CAMPEP_0175981184 /NCGR_PEP_ID=MMETSP0108-20121206/47196_1 /TAXON_ID=195067 ORGANISM="Goniomonas pacifica, Strain CCMP1869" /NCGR_SAMPLE_ID=MMETSP0108 /ASSEMBLY_ACC=CAM_ASM_000204 /LENGTH=55 /DNA_ID=CAMNT_0017311689 /DNA_START=96 /DNA_END=260 /DNA_ORIENTATION=+
MSPRSWSTALYRLRSSVDPRGKLNAVIRTAPSASCHLDVNDQIGDSGNTNRVALA